MPYKIFSHINHWYLFLSLFLLPQRLPAQPAEIRQFLESPPAWGKLNIQDPEAILDFYRTLGYQPAWTGQACRENRDYLLRVLENAEDQGLEEKDYQFNFLQQYKDSLDQFQFSENWLIPEIRMTDAAIHYFRDIAFGNTAPSFGYAGLNYIPGCISISWQLAKHISYRLLPQLASMLQPPFPEITKIRMEIMRMRRVITDQEYTEEKLISTTVSPANKILLQKLLYLGILDSIDGKITSKELVEKVKQAQQLFGLLADGSIRSTFLKELNTPLRSRLQQLKLSINYYRWLYCLTREQPVVVVNIPAAFLKVYHEGKSIMEMRMIVGKPSTPTPTLSSKITEVILYPYWNVPYDIATRELLPAIKRNRGYINANNYQVLNRQGKIVDPAKVNWSVLSASNFPYVIRQSTGCDNALGLLKLNFYNPFSVYLHDTPSKSLFMLNKRFYSHGCMRMENPMDLGHLLLKENSIAIDTLEEKGCLRNQSPVIVPAGEPLPVIVWYNPAGLDASGKLVYYDDIYGKFPRIK